MLKERLENSPVAAEGLITLAIWSAGVAAAYVVATTLSDTSLLRVLSLIGVGIALAAFARMEYLLILLMASSLVTRGPINIMGDITLFDIIVLLMATYLIIQLFQKQRSLHLSREARLMIGLVALICFSEILGYFYFPRGLFFTVSVKPFVQLMEFIVITFTIVVCVNKREQVLNLAKWQIICAIVLACVALYESQRGVIFINGQSVFGNSEYLLHGEQKGNPNTLLLIIPAIAFLFYGKNTNVMKLGLLGFILCAFIPQGTRTFYLSLAGAVFGMFWIKNTRKPMWIVLIVMLAFLVNAEIVMPRLGEIFKGIHGYFLAPYSAAESSTFGRLVLWKTAPRLLLDHPLWGYGVNGYGMEVYLNPSIFMNERTTLASWAMGALNPSGKTHNEYLQILLDHGAIAFLIAMFLLVRTLQKCRTKMETSDEELAGVYRALFVSFIGFLFGFMSVSLLSYHGNNFLQMFFFMNMGLVYASIESSSPHEPDALQKNEGDEHTRECEHKKQH